MAALVLPTSSMPGQSPQEAGGRLINSFVESLGETGPNKFKTVRCPGMVQFATTAQNSQFRGGIQVGSVAYLVWDSGKVVKVDALGATTVLTGTVLGTGPVSLARNNALTPDVVCVAPGNGAFVFSTTAVSAYPDVDVGSPNSVCFLKGYFVFSYGDGKMRSSGINTTAINSLDVATAESNPDTLYRVVTDGEVLIAAGSSSIEFWQVNSEPSGFPFSPVATHKPARGIAGQNSIGGHEEGFGNGIFVVGDDYTVRQLVGFTSRKVSPPDLDRLIAAVKDKNDIQVSAYVTQGHPFVVVQCDDWTWEFDVTLERWHERQSYNLSRWKGVQPFKAFDRWLCGNTQNANIFTIDADDFTEDGQPLIWEVETAPQGNFPYGSRVRRLDLFFAGGVGKAPGADPIETNPSVRILISPDLGLSWSNAFVRELGPQGLSPNITVNNLGICRAKGIKLRFLISDPVHVALIGGDVDAIPLRN